MDVALFGPYTLSKFQFQKSIKWSVLEWFGMVHRIPVTIVIARLRNLKSRSLLENVGNGFEKIGMHDLWREFARLETKAGEFERRRWMFEWDEYNMLEEGRVTNGGHWVNVSRMFFLEKGFVKLSDVSFFCFPSVTVLKLNPQFGSLHQLDLSGLKDLKSLELSYIDEWGAQPKPLISLFGLGSLLKLVFLQWSNIPSGSPCIDEISRLTNLQVLDLDHSDRVPNLSNLLILQVACFRSILSVETITGFSSNHTKLEFLDLSHCVALQSCPGVGELVALQELCLKFCCKLKEVPNLQKLKQLRKLDVSSCWLLQGLPGLGNLVSLVKLYAKECKGLVELPNMGQLRNLRILDVHSSNLIGSLPGLNELVCLRSLNMVACDNLTQLPNMHKLTNLQDLQFNRKWSLQSFVGLSDLISLRSLYVGVGKVHDGSDLRKLTMLTSLDIAGLQGQELSSLAELVLLESATISNCKGVRVLPDLQKLSRLNELELKGCEFEDMSGLRQLPSLQILTITKCGKLEALPDLGELGKLQVLIVEDCAQLRDVHGILGLATCSQLSELSCSGCPMQEFPDLAHFPKLSFLCLSNCENLTNLTCTGPLSPAFEHLDVSGLQGQGLSSLAELVLLESATISNCKGVRVLPDLQKLSRLNELELKGCEFEDMSGLRQLPSLQILTITKCGKLEALPDLGELGKLQVLIVEDCAQLRDVHGILGLATCSQLSELSCSGCPMQEFPDLAHFPKLSFLCLSNCENLTNLTCKGPSSPEFNSLDVSGCKSLQALPDLTNSREMRELIVSYRSVVLSAQIQEMKKRWPSMVLIKGDVDEDEDEDDDDEDDTDLIIEA